MWACVCVRICDIWRNPTECSALSSARREQERARSGNVMTKLNIRVAELQKYTHWVYCLQMRVLCKCVLLSLCRVSYVVCVCVCLLSCLCECVGRIRKSSLYRHFELTIRLFFSSKAAATQNKNQTAKRHSRSHSSRTELITSVFFRSEHLKWIRVRSKS